MNMKSLTKALAKISDRVQESIKEGVQDVLGPKQLQDYELGEQVGTGGPGLFWKLYRATKRVKTSADAQNAEVCLWLFDKKWVGDRVEKKGGTRAAVRELTEIFRADAAALMRIRHPGIVRVIEPLDESKHAMAMVTEPLFCSLANAMGRHGPSKDLPPALEELELSDLERKHGVLQLTETLTFLHANARMIHRAISPESVFITTSGAWKLACLGFAVSLDKVEPPLDQPAFLYSEFDDLSPVIPLSPPLDFTAPELTRAHADRPTAAVDVFSLGCLVYFTMTKNTLINSVNNLKTFTNAVSYLHMRELAGCPPELALDLRRLTAADPIQRGGAVEFSSSGWFREDTLLRALRFLDHMLERDNLQKADFLKSLKQLWKSFDSRVLRYKVLPPLAAELRSEAMQQQVLPMIMTVAEVQEPREFEVATLPHLLPVLVSGSQEVLLALVKHCKLLMDKVPEKVRDSHVLPMLLRALDDGDVRIQEEALKATTAVANKVDYTVLKRDILPRLHTLSLKTTAAVVRVNALIALGQLVARLDKTAVTDVLTTLTRCSSVDHSAPTLMCVLGVCDVIAKHNGVEYAAEHILPLLIPLTIAPQLNAMQFTKFMRVIYDALKRVEDKRGTTVDISDLKRPLSPDKPDTPPAQPTTSGRACASSDSPWDSDWAATQSQGRPVPAKGTATPAPLAASATPLAPPIPAVATGRPGSQFTAQSPGPASAGSFTGLEWPPPLTAVSNAGVPSVSSGGDLAALSGLGGPDMSSGTGVRRASSSGSLPTTAAAAPLALDPFAWPPMSAPRSTAPDTALGASGSTTMGASAMSSPQPGGSSWDFGGLAAAPPRRISGTSGPLPSSDWTMPVPGAGGGGTGADAFGSWLTSPAPLPPQQQAAAARIPVIPAPKGPAGVASTGPTLVNMPPPGRPMRPPPSAQQAQQQRQGTGPLLDLL